MCGAAWTVGSWTTLAEHLVERAATSDDRHVMWLNRNVTKHQTDADALAVLLERAAAGDEPAAERVKR